MIPTFKPSIVRKDMDAVLTCLVDENLEGGEGVKEFLKKCSLELSLQGVHALREFQRGLEILLRTAGALPGKRVALSPLSPSWYLPVLEDLQLLPVYLDVDPDTCTLLVPGERKPEEMADLFLVRHHLGYENSLLWLEEAGVPVVEDITEILAGRLAREAPSQPGALGIFCLEEPGFISSLAGGALIYAGKKREAVLLKKTVEEKLSGNQLLTDPQAAMAAAQWSRMGKFTSKREEIRTIFLSALQKSRNRTFAVGEEKPHVPFSFPVLVNSGAREAAAYARKKKILCTPAFENSILAVKGELEGEFPGAKSLVPRCLLFPLYPSLKSGDVDTIAKVLSTLP